MLFITSPSCIILDNVSQEKRGKKQQSSLPVFSLPICLQQLFHRWQEQKGQQDSAIQFTSLQTWSVWMARQKPRHSCVGRPPPLATTNSHGTVSPLRQTFSYKSSSPAWIKPNASRLNVAVSLEGRHMCSQFGLRKSCKWNLPDWVRPSANHKTLLLQNVFYAHSTKVQRHRFKYLISFYFSSGFICYSAQQHTGNCGKI